ncbi:hypothetical protein B0G82_5820 [Paraburkholderia sp. BL17N1]|nr:hypothetical protein B0G82_5820 [Paraburkholderia sp. BL17N1]
MAPTHSANGSVTRGASAMRSRMAASASLMLRKVCRSPGIVLLLSYPGKQS